jgi:hypothetical protein
MKDARWKQPTPLMQFQAILMGLDGSVMVIEDKITPLETALPRVRDHIEQLRNLIPFLEERKSWNLPDVPNQPRF